METWEKADFEQVDMNPECTAYTMTNLDDLIIEWTENTLGSQSWE